MSRPGALARSERLPLAAAAGAGLLWCGLIVLAVVAELGPQISPFDLRRFLFVFMAVVASLFTFAPLALVFNLPGLTWRGLLGCTTLAYTLVFVPAPSDWLLSPRELPVYALLAISAVAAVSALAEPIAAAVGRMIFQARARRYDLRRIRRQGYIAGFTAGLVVVFGGAGLQNPLWYLLLLVGAVSVELIFLALVRVEGQESSLR